MNDILFSLRDLLRDSGIHWAVCGGFALDLFLGRETRVHGDLDIAVPEADRGRIECFMRGHGWQVLEFRGQGRLRALDEHTASETGRNLMCVREGCELVTFWPSNEPGLVLHEWHSEGIRALNYMEFLFPGVPAHFGRSPDRAIIRAGGIPYLAPEVVLRYKAAQPERETNRRDYEAVFPRLNEEQRTWLLGTLPPDHPWRGDAP